MFKKLSVLMLLAVAMVTKSADDIRFECLSKDKDYYNSDEMVSRRKHHKCGCEQFCCINTATLTVSGIANFNGSNVYIRNLLTLAGVNINDLLGIAGTAGINDGTAAVGLVDADGAATNSEGAVGLGLTTFGSFYSNAATVLANGDAIPFASQGTLSVIARSAVVPTNTNFVLPAVGTYEIDFFASLVTDATGAQLSLETSINGGTSFAAVSSSIVGTALNATATQISGKALVTTTVANTLVHVVNSGPAVTLSATGGGAGIVSAGLIIKRIA